MRKAHTELLSLDLLALSLLSCLLASVVGILVLGGEGVETSQRVALSKRAVQLSSALNETRSSLEDIAAKLNRSALERRKQNVESELEEVRQKIDARQKLALAQAEIATRSKELTSLAGSAPDNEPSPFGNYHGAFILVECVEDRAIIYPKKDQIGLKPTQEQITELAERIQQTGFVLFVVRPSGWFGNSYHAVYPAVSKQLDEAQENGGKTIGRATLPLEENASLTRYLPNSPP